MPIEQHPNFNRPTIATKLWRYTDIPKFLELLTSRSLWLTNLEVLAHDDPYEGNPGVVRFPHRLWKTIDEVPEALQKQITEIYGAQAGNSPEAAFTTWFMLQEQECIYTAAWRRQYFINCWHASSHESAAMWKIYGSPGAGVAIITNGGRMGTALQANAHTLYLGAVDYQDPDISSIGRANAFEAILEKRESYRDEHEVRLVYMDAEGNHDPLEEFHWNAERMRFDDVVEDRRPLTLGTSLECDVDVLIERVIIAPTAPPWYLPMIERMRDSLGYRFPVSASKLLTAADVIP